MNTLAFLCFVYTGWRIGKLSIWLVKSIRNAESPWLDIGRPGSGAAGGH